MRPARIADIGRAHSTNDARDGRASRHRRRGSLHAGPPRSGRLTKRVIDLARRFVAAA
ncbi:hypothetical protein E3O37_13325 [Burkholderia pseudomallei]|nr:hypothetical protein E3O37_13325 [Burkholderia pseudomallei]